MPKGKLPRCHLIAINRVVGSSLLTRMAKLQYLGWNKKNALQSFIQRLHVGKGICINVFCRNVVLFT